MILLVAAAISMLGALGGDLLANPRALFASARDGILPRRPASIHPRFHTPFLAIGLYAALGFVLAASGVFETLATLSSVAILLVYLATAAATIELRRRDVRATPAVFRLIGGRLIPLIAASFVRDPSKREQPHYLWAGSLDSTQTKFIGEIPSQVAYAPPGHLLSVRDGTLMNVRFDADKLEIQGEPEPLADAVFYFKPTGAASFSASTNGTVTYRAPFGGESLTWVDRTGRRTGALPVTGDFSSVRLSRDGASVVAALVDPRIGTNDLWLYGTRRETATRLTFSAGYENVPVLTPDGARLFYSSDTLGVPDIFVKQMGSAEDDRPFAVAPGYQNPEDVSPDGRWLVYRTTDYGDTSDDLFVTPLEGDPKPTPFVRTPAVDTNARFSPDGTAVAYSSNESGDRQVYVKPFPGPGQARQVSTRGGWQPEWSHDGRHLYFRHLNGVYEADVRAPDAEPRLLFETDRPVQALEVSPDGTRFLVIAVDALAMQTPTRVVVNWPALLKNGKR